MEDPDRIGVNIMVAGLSGAAGLVFPPAALIGPVVQYIVQEFTSRRTEGVTQVVQEAVQSAGMSFEDLPEWVRGSDRHAVYLSEAMEAAWATLDGYRLKTLAYVLAEGLRDEAKLDIDQMIIRTVRELEAGHVRVLAKIGERPVTARGSDTPPYSDAELSRQFPGLGTAITPILATLVRVGCIYVYVIDGGNVSGRESQGSHAISPFGWECLAKIRASGELAALQMSAL